MHTSHDLLGEEAELEAAFKGRHWRDLGLPDLQNTEPSGLTPQAFRFYLPAYLLTVLNAYWESDVLPECTVWMLDPDMCAGGTHEKWFAEVIGLLDGEQRAAVRAFLEFMRDEHASDLEGYGIDFDRIIRFYEDFA